MSFRAIAALPYNQGFKNPRGGFPADISSSLRSAMMLAKIGLEKLVPSLDLD